MSEISETEIKAMTKEQNYMRGYKDGKSDVLDKISTEIKERIANEPMTSFREDGLREALEVVEKYKGGDGE